ncbi:MAG: TIGR03857 family LLM class F420-dependent oxidoreductase [Acidimicrobiales bacterium]
MTADLLPELGFYGLAGHVDDPRVLIDECRQAEALGLGACFLSERFNVKEAATITGVAGAVTDTLGIATGVTNVDTRHPAVVAAWGSTMQALTRGRFALGFGRGFAMRSKAWGLPSPTMAVVEDAVGLYRRLWRGETIVGHDGPLGRFGALRIGPFAEPVDVPVMMAALGLRTMRWAGRVMDGVILHTFFSDEALARCVAAVRAGAEEAGRDPASVKVWSVLATVCDRPDDHLKDLVARMATYLQVYGDTLVATNGWDPALLARFRADEVVRSIPGAIDAIGTREQWEHIATLVPESWLPAAVGSPAQCAARVADQFAQGCDGVILHGATPTQLTGVVEAWRAVRASALPAALTRRPTNPGR